MTEFFYPSNGKGRIHAVIWEPECQPIAVNQIVHGVAEHILRYQRMAEYLNSAGIIVGGEDHMGHGGSVSVENPMGVISGRWETMAEDSVRLSNILREKYPKLPMFLLGHSMGSFLVRTILILHPEADLQGAIICGTAWQPGMTLALGRVLCRLDCRLRGSNHVSGLINALAFGGYSKAFRPCRTAHDWICSVPEEVDRYENDPFCGYDISSGMADAMMSGLQLIEKPGNLEKMNRTLPVWFYAGNADPVGDMTKGVTKAVEAFRQYGMERVSCTFYEGRHEIHNEAVGQQVFADIVSFVQKNQ